MATGFSGDPEEVGHANQVFEAEVRGALERGGYPAPTEQVRLPSLAVDRHYQLDMLVQRPAGGAILIQLYYQTAAGSAQERVPYKALQLIGSVHAAGDNACGYLVLDGTAITDTDFFTRELTGHLLRGHRIRIITLPDFIERAKSGVL